MFFLKKARLAGVLALTTALGLSSLVLSQDDKSDKKKVVPPGTPVLWRDPGQIAARDLLTGPGGDEMKPDLSSITYLKDESGSGYSVKYRIKDGAGKTWVAKVGNEARPETASTRLVWALGYVTEINYLVPCVKIPGAAKPRKKVDMCEGGGFANVRFEARPDDVQRTDIWSWQNNPFAGTKEMKGLIIIQALLNNWDLKDDNNKIIARQGEGGQTELHYIISDLGATFGKTGNFITHSRNEPEKFAKTKFVEAVAGGRVKFAFDGKNKGLFENITVGDARWVAGLLAQLTDRQIGDAMRAANFNAGEVALLIPAMRTRIDELVRATGAQKPALPSAAEAAPAPSPSAEATPAPTATVTPTEMPTPTATPTATPTPTPPPHR
ncbi:MAG: hypothetical protein LC800_04435 [Acidobacteria bacterium]|nr:hypothetical protein [Acidobacteriota bacterium]